MSLILQDQLTLSTKTKEQVEKNTEDIAKNTQEIEDLEHKIAGVYKYKGTVDTYADLPTEDNVTGDVWDVRADGMNYAWTDRGEWDQLGPTIDLSGYVPTTRTINEKALDSDITLEPSDIGAATAAQGELADTALQETDLKTINGESVVGEGNITIDSLPSQAGNANKFLTTDGTDASWADALRNTATGTNSLTIDGVVNTSNNSINIGKNSIAGGVDVVIGYLAQDNGGSENILIGYNTSTTGSGRDSSVIVGNSARGDISSVSVGYSAKALWNGSVAIGRNSQVGRSSASGQNAIAIGKNADCYGTNAIQLGQGSNGTKNTMNVGLSDSLNVQLLNGSGKVPTDRYIPLTGATASAAGILGAVPAPAAGDNEKFLRGDGAWAEAGRTASYDDTTGTVEL